ncbi:MAG: hypothetical protein WD872_04355 [Pirellulaceae bacterium]
MALLTWTVLLVGTAAAARRSRFVVTGKPQVSLQTLLVGVTFLAAYLAIYPRPHEVGWERAALLPVLVSATIGYTALIREAWLRRRSRGAT